MLKIIYLALIMLVLAPGVSVFGAEPENGAVGAMAGRVFSCVDYTEVVASLELRRYLDSAETAGEAQYSFDTALGPVRVQRFLNGTFWVDSLPPGYYRVTVRGFPYDKMFNSVTDCCDFNIWPVRVAVDSVSAVVTRLIPEDICGGTPCLPWIRRLYPDRNDEMRVRGWDMEHPTGHIYCRMDLRRSGFVGRIVPLDDGDIPNEKHRLRLDLGTVLTYRERDRDILCDNSVVGKNVFVYINTPEPDNAAGGDLLLEPALGSTTLTLSEGEYDLHLIAADTSVYKLTLSANRLDIEAIDSVAVRLPTGGIDF